MEPTELIKEQTANGTFLVSTLSVRGTERTVYAFYENGSAAELSCLPSGGSSILGNIYVGKVKNIAANINAAFIEIGGWAALLLRPGRRGNACFYYAEEKEGAGSRRRASGPGEPGGRENESSYRQRKPEFRRKIPGSHQRETASGTFLQTGACRKRTAPGDCGALSGR